MKDPTGPRLTFLKNSARGACALLLSLAGAAAGAQSNATLRTGFPKTFVSVGPVTFSTPVLADLDNTGRKSIIFGTSGDASGHGWLYVLNNDGSLRWKASLPSSIASSPAVGDITGDGFKDIVVGCGANTDLSLPGGVFAFNRNGTPLWSFSPKDTDKNGQPDHVWSTPALGDIDGDGVADVVFGSFDFYVYALKGTTGLPIAGWPVFVRDTVWSSPALADLDGDGRLEVVIGADSHYEGSPWNTVDGGALWVFRSDGSQFPGWPKFVAPPSGQTPVGIQSSPAVGDIDGDGCPEIVVGTGTSSSTAEKFLYAWHRDGSAVAGWPVALSGHADKSPVLADLTGDGVLDVVVADDAHHVYGIRGNGTTIFNMVPKTYLGAAASSVGEITVAQIGANNPAILVGGVDFMVTIISKTGTQISADGTNGLIYGTGHPVNGPAIGDIDGGGTTLTLVAVSGVSATNSTDAGVYAWPMGAVGALPWPHFRRDESRSAWASPVHACPIPPVATKFHPLTPCRVSDSRNSGNLTYGGPAFTAGEQRTITYAGVCGIPATARALAMNVTATNAGGNGNLVVFPTGDGVPDTSTLNFTPGRTRAVNVVAPLSFDGLGHITIFANVAPPATVDVITDVSGYFE